MSALQHREKRFVAPLPLLPFTRSSALDYRVLSVCRAKPVALAELHSRLENRKLDLCLSRLLELGFLLEFRSHRGPRQFRSYTLTAAGEIWANRFFSEHHAALEVLSSEKS